MKTANKIRFEFSDGSVKICEGGVASGWLESIMTIIKKYPIIDWRKYQWTNTTLEEIKSEEQADLQKQIDTLERELKNQFEQQKAVAVETVKQEVTETVKAQTIVEIDLQRKAAEDSVEKFHIDVFGDA